MASRAFRTVLGADLGRLSGGMDDLRRWRLRCGQGGQGFLPAL